MNDIRDIKGPTPTAEPGTGLPLWAGAATLALAGLAAWRWRRMRRAEPGPAGAPPAALAGLAGLGPDGGSLDDRDYYFRLAAAAREILETRFAFAATALTVAEIAVRLEQTPLPPAQAEALAALLGRAEQTCFAAAPRTRADRARDWQTAAALAAGRRP